MKKVILLIGLIVCTVFFVNTANAQKTLKCGVKGTSSKTTKKYQRYRKSPDAKEGWPTFEAAQAQFHEDLIEFSGLSCDNDDCFGTSLFDCKPKIVKVNQGALNKSIIGELWWNEHPDLVKYDWRCTDCKRIMPKSSLEESSAGGKSLTQSGSIDCPDWETELATISPYKAPDVFRLWIDLEGDGNEVVITITNIDNGEVVLQDHLSAVDECHLHTLANLSDQSPGIYDFEILVNGEIIKKCAVSLE